MTRPPRLAEWLVERTLTADRAERDGVLGDLAEEHAALHSRAGAGAAARWYWQQAVRSLAPNLRRRFRGPRIERPTSSRGGLMDTLLQDVRHGARMLVRRPAVTAVALASLAVGIALPAVVFSLLNTVVLRPLALADPDRVAVVLELRQASANHNFSYPDFVDYRGGQRSFTDLAAYSRSSATTSDRSGARVLEAELVSGGYFATLGIRLAGGRGLTDADDRPDAAPSVVVSQSLWHDIAGDAVFAPRTIVLNTREFSIVGVVAREFGGMEVGRDVRVWAPVHAQPILEPFDGGSLTTRRTASWLTIVGRLRGGVSRDHARADLERVDAAVAVGSRRPPRRFAVAPGRQGDSTLPEQTAGPLRLLLGAAVLVLLVACVNVANLLLARASEREREIAVRAALGAGRGRLVRLVLVETLMLSATGAVLALAAAHPLAVAAARFIARYGEPAALDVAVDWRTITFIAVTAAAATLITGIGPVATLLRSVRASALADGGRGASSGPLGTRTRHALVAAQFALSLALVVAAGLLTTTVRNLRSIPTGLDLDHVALLAVDPSAAQYDRARTQTYIHAAVERLAASPGARAAGFGRVIPLGFGGSRTSIVVPGYLPAPDEDMEINFNIVSPSYFDATGIALLDGRVFGVADISTSEPVAVVNEAMAARYWRGKAAVGQHLSLGDDSPPLRVVGVARDVKYRELREGRGPSFYLPLSQMPARDGVLHVRTAGDPRGMLETLRRVVQETDPAVPITAVRTLRAQADRNLNDDRLAMAIGVTLGGAALLLAAVGLYGSLSYMVGQRTRELGVRMALGATSGDVGRLVLWQGMTLCLAGTIGGAAFAVPLSRALESRLFGVRAVDPLTFLASAMVLVAIALLASWLPAHRAARLDPVEALRAE